MVPNMDRLVPEIQQERLHRRHLTKKNMGREKKEPAMARHHHLDSGEEIDWDTATSFSPLLLDWFPTVHRAAHPPGPSLLICEFLGSVIDECWVMVGRMPSSLALGLSYLNNHVIMVCLS